MKRTIKILWLVWTTFLLSAGFKSFACSMCKVTINGRTYLGNNEDSWRMGSRIWFEKAIPGKLGALYVGYGNGFPQGGMNEAGLAFDGLTVYPKPVKTAVDKKHITDPLDFVKEIMRTCRTVEDVRRYAIQYDRQAFFNNGEYFFADRQGNYLVMEPDTMITGNKDKYLIANFCPSITPEKERLQWGRYKRGEIFLDNHSGDTGANYCLALVDTMHECRKKLGDGTMYSFVADLQKGDFTLYFYHDYQHEVKFNLTEELAKGDHVLDMPSLFPINREFKKLADYKTPQNSIALLTCLCLFGGLFVFSSTYFLISFFRNRKTAGGAISIHAKIKLVLFALGMVLLYYILALLRNQAIFYSAAPYHDYKFSVLNIAAYIPFLMFILLVPLIRMNVKVFRDSAWRLFSKYLFAANNIAYLTLIILFAYWGLYNVL